MKFVRVGDVGGVCGRMRLCAYVWVVVRGVCVYALRAGTSGFGCACMSVCVYSCLCACVCAVVLCMCSRDFTR